MQTKIYRQAQFASRRPLASSRAPWRALPPPRFAATKWAEAGVQARRHLCLVLWHSAPVGISTACCCICHITRNAQSRKHRCPSTCKHSAPSLSPRQPAQSLLAMPLRQQAEADAARLLRGSRGGDRSGGAAAGDARPAEEARLASPHTPSPAEMSQLWRRHRRERGQALARHDTIGACFFLAGALCCGSSRLPFHHRCQAPCRSLPPPPRLPAVRLSLLLPDCPACSDHRGAGHCWSAATLVRRVAGRRTAGADW